jgi:hypothetical protein
MKKIRSGLVGVAIIGSLVGTIPITAFAEPVPTDAERSACTSDAFTIVRGFNPQSERGDCLSEVKKVATESDLPTAFQPNLMLSGYSGRQKGFVVSVLNAHRETSASRSLLVYRLD